MAQNCSHVQIGYQKDFMYKLTTLRDVITANATTSVGEGGGSGLLRARGKVDLLIEWPFSMTFCQNTKYGHGFL